MLCILDHNCLAVMLQMVVETRNPALVLLVLRPTGCISLPHPSCFLLCNRVEVIDGFGVKNSLLLASHSKHNLYEK